MALEEETANMGDEFWLFGYGSLIWKPPPHFDRRIPGWVTGYVRRFWQASQDHRGTPTAPGRVVTLISRSYWERLTDHHEASPDDKVWGVAYRIAADKVAEVKDYLDIREINGYTIHYTPFHLASEQDGPAEATSAVAGSGPIRTLVYIGTPDNDQFVGPQDPQDLAEHIYRSEGPSGLNRDYLWGLEKSLDELSPSSGDEHVTDLSERVRAIAAREAEREKTDLATVSPVSSTSLDRRQGHQPEQQQQHHLHEFQKVSSVDEQEETEKA